MTSRHGNDAVRLQPLLNALLLIGSDLELSVLLQRILEAACDLCGARHGALDVLDEAQQMARLLTVERSDDQVEPVAASPSKSGVVNEARAGRDTQISRGSETVTGAKGQGPARSYLGTAIRMRGEVIGNLSLTEKYDDKGFSESDVDVIDNLAAIAGIAIANARLQKKVQDLSGAGDHDRIARELYDTVLQRLYGVGLTLQSSFRLADDGMRHLRIQDAIDELDRTILLVRTAIVNADDRA